MSASGTSSIHTQSNPQHQESSSKATHAEKLFGDIKDLVVHFIRSADTVGSTKHQDQDEDEADESLNSSIVEHYPPRKLQQLLNFSLPERGVGKDGLVSTAKSILKYSVNVWQQGFLDKLYASPTPVGLAADTLLTALNTNVHVYEVSPALTLVEKETCRAMASLFGLNGPYSGGVSQPGGSAANQSSMVIARNNLFPETKTAGYGGRRFVLFTSAHGHYSVEKAAQMFGFGSNAVRSIAVDESGRMRPDSLEAAIQKAKADGETPFYVNATAGTTVLGSFDPLEEIADVCSAHKLWLHVDGSWGGPVIFSEKQRYKLKGIERADSIAICPHKMMNVALTCSLLLAKDLRQLHKAMSLPAGYLFHSGDKQEINGVEDAAEGKLGAEEEADEFWDLGELVPQCGRRGDCLKLSLSWVYYGNVGFGAYIDHGFEMASYLASLVSSNSKFSLLSENPPPCLQVCFYFDKQIGADQERRNNTITERTRRALVPKGFMIDYAPGEEGKFFRVVVNGQTRRETVERLIRTIEESGDKIKV